MSATSIKEQLVVIRDGLTAWKEANKATVQVGSRISDLHGMFVEGAPLGTNVRILFAGETKRGEIEEAGFVDRAFLVVISMGRGLAAPGDDTVETAGHKPLYDLVDSLRNTLRNIEFCTDAEVAARTNTNEHHADVKSVGIFTLPDGRPVDGYQIELTLGTQLPAPDDE